MEKDKKDHCEYIMSLHYPFSLGSCWCRTSMDYAVSSIPQSTDWPVSFPLQSAVEHVSATGLQLKTMVSRLSLKLGSRLAHCEDNYRKICTSEVHIDIIRKGYKPTWIKVHLSRGLRLATPPSPLMPPIFSILKLPDFLGKEPTVRSKVQGEYVSSYFKVPNSKRSPDKWRLILNLKNFINTFVM